MKTNAPLSINTPFRRISLINFLRFAALGLSAPFVVVYFTKQGFSATHIGLLISISSILELILNPIFNQLANRIGGHRRLFSAYMVSAGAANFTFATIPTHAILGGAFLINQATIRSSSGLLTQLSIKRFDQLRLNLYSKSRMWGSVGWAVATIASSALIGWGSYTLVFMGSALAGFFILFFVNELPFRTNEIEHETLPAQPRRMGFYILAISQFFFFMGMGATSSFLWVFIEQDLNVPDYQLGFLAAFFAISELPAMLMLDGLIARLGARNIYMVGLVGLSLIWVGYSVTPSIGWFVLLQAIRGTMYSLYTVGISFVIARTSRTANVATNQAIIEGTMPALALLITGPIAGWIFDNVGSAWMFRYAAIMGVIAVGILLVNYHRLEDETPNEQFGVDHATPQAYAAD